MTSSSVVEASSNPKCFSKYLVNVMIVRLRFYGRVGFIIVSKETGFLCMFLYIDKFCDKVLLKILLSDKKVEY
jgi:hypothetical protein